MTYVVNNSECGDKNFKVYLWTGAGYNVAMFEVFAFNEEHALECVLAYCEEKSPLWAVYHRRTNRRRPYRRRTGRTLLLHRPHNGR